MSLSARFVSLRRSLPWLLAAGTAAYSAYWFVRVAFGPQRRRSPHHHHQPTTQSQRRVQRHREAEAQRHTFKQLGHGLPDVGASRFVLVDARDGVPRSDAELLGGGWNLLYFGYTHCPDICPAELRRMTQLLLWAEGDGVSLRPFLVSIDAQRDTVAQLRRYLTEFHPRIVGLTGTPQQLADVARSFRMYTFRSGNAADLLDDDYLVDHSIFIILVSPEGRFIDYFGPKMPLDDVYRRIRFHIGA